MFVLSDVIENANTPYKLIKLDSTKADTCLPPEPLKLETATNENLKSIHVSNEVKLKLRKDYLRFLKAHVQELQERSPLKYLSEMSYFYQPFVWSLKLRQPSFILTLLLKSFICWNGCLRSQQKPQSCIW